MSLTSSTSFSSCCFQNGRILLNNDNGQQALSLTCPRRTNAKRTNNEVSINCVLLFVYRTPHMHMRSKTCTEFPSVTEMMVIFFFFHFLCCFVFLRLFVFRYFSFFCIKLHAHETQSSQRYSCVRVCNVFLPVNAIRTALRWNTKCLLGCCFFLVCC